MMKTDEIRRDILNIPSSYKKLLKEDLSLSKYDDLFSFVISQYEKKTIFPESKDIYRALSLTPVERVKVVILGQDPYINRGQANGLAFSSYDKKIPPSLKNIYKEMEYEYDKHVLKTGDLSYLAKQVVLLLNTILTVEEGRSLSHKNIGWEEFTSRILYLLNEKNDDIIYLIWGEKAFKSVEKLNLKKIVKTSHPSPLSFNSGFYKSNCFKNVNELLRLMNKDEIRWYIEDDMRLF